MDANLPNSFTDFLVSDYEDSVTQPSDPTQQSYDSRDSNLSSAKLTESAVDGFEEAGLAFP